MNKNIDTIKDSKSKNCVSFPTKILCDKCNNNCKTKGCKCSCHIHNRYLEIMNEEKNSKYKFNININDFSLEEEKNINDSIYQNIGTNIQKPKNKNENSKSPEINIDLSKNLNDLSQYYRDIYTKTKLELDIEKEKTIVLEKCKEMNKIKMKGLIKDKNILLEKIKNLSEQLDRVISMLHDITEQKKNIEDEYYAFRNNE